MLEVELPGGRCTGYGQYLPIAKSGSVYPFSGIVGIAIYLARQDGFDVPCHRGQKRATVQLWRETRDWNETVILHIGFAWIGTTSKDGLRRKRHGARCGLSPCKPAMILEKKPDTILAPRTQGLLQVFHFVVGEPPEKRRVSRNLAVNQLDGPLLLPTFELTSHWFR